MEDRKMAEIEWSDKRRTAEGKEKEYYTSNMKYYSVVRATTEYVSEWIGQHCKDRDVFEIACGNGGYSHTIADVARTCVAADIAPKTIQQAKDETRSHSVYRNIDYRVLDCEKTGLPDNSFDVVCEGGALHHMDLDVAYKEVARLLRPGGKFMCVEAIRHNPAIHLYRKLTPHLRTEWEAEHILGRKEVKRGLKYFKHIEVRHLHFATLCAVPFRNKKFFKQLLSFAERVDSVITRIPCMKWLAWQAVFILSDPIKNRKEEEL